MRRTKLPPLPPTSLHTEILFESIDKKNVRQIRDLVAHDNADLGGHDWLHSDGRTPMHRAVQSGDVSMMELLLELGGSVNVTDGKGCTPLHLACRIGDGNMLRVLLTAPEVDFVIGSHVRARADVVCLVCICQHELRVCGSVMRRGVVVVVVALCMSGWLLCAAGRARATPLSTSRLCTASRSWRRCSSTPAPL
jgi:hypothetical protein